MIKIKFIFFCSRAESGDLLIRGSVQLIGRKSAPRGSGGSVHRSRSFQEEVRSMLGTGNNLLGAKACSESSNADCLRN